MKTLKAVLALALAVPAGAAPLAVESAPQAAGRITLPVFALSAAAPSADLAAPQAMLSSQAQLGLPSSAIAAPLQGAAQASDVQVSGTPFQWMTTEKALEALPSLAPLRAMGAVAPQAAAGDAYRWSVGFDGSAEKLMAAPTASGSGPSNGGGSANGAGGSGSGSNSGSGPKASPLAVLVARIESQGQVQVNPQTGEAVKLLAPKVEPTANGQTVHVVALTGKVDAKGAFTKTGIVAVAQSQEASETQLSATSKRVQQKEAGTEIVASLKGTAATIRGFASDHTDVIDVVSHDVKAKQADFQKEVAAAQHLVGAKDFKSLVAEIGQQGQFDIQAVLAGGSPRIVHELEKAQAPDGTQSQFVAVLDLDAKGAPSRLTLVRITMKSTPNPNGKGDTARQDQVVYTADLSGKLLQATTMGKDHSLDVSDFDRPADAAAQADFDAIVAKVSQP